MEHNVTLKKPKSLSNQLYTPLCFHRTMWKTIVEKQVASPQEKMFIICPMHARSWVKTVLVPCLEADLFMNRDPVIEPVRARRNNAPIDTETNPNNPLADDDPLDVYQDETKPSSESEPMGPWAWFPRFSCFSAPPLRHRLFDLIKARQVLIVFSGPSLFTEPACRAQLRLAFHLTRQRYLPPPGIIIWPATAADAKPSRSHKSVNESSSIKDHDKYLPLPVFGDETNDPDDPAETVKLKTKIPSIEQTITVFRYICMRATPCVFWNNSKTIKQNLEPLVWKLSSFAQIQGY